VNREGFNLDLERGSFAMAVKIGEVQSKLSADVKKTEDLSVHLRERYSDRLETVKFRPAQDLKKGDTLKITIEKV